MVFPCLFLVKPKQGERKMFSTKTRILLIMLLVSSINIFSQDADEKKLGWFFEGKLAGLWAGGNSESFTLGLGATLKHIWTNSELRFDAGGLQTESSTTTRTAVGTTEDFQVNEDKKTDIVVDTDGINERIISLPVPAANYFNVTAVEGKIYYSVRSSSSRETVSPETVPYLRNVLMRSPALLNTLTSAYSSTLSTVISFVIVSTWLYWSLCSIFM